VSAELHQFIANENVDYRQINSNFSNLNDSLINRISGTVQNYNALTFETELVLSDNTTHTLINRTNNVLTVNDTVWVYYWTNIDTDGYVAVKIGTPTPEGGAGDCVGSYINTYNDSVIVNNINEDSAAAINIQSSNRRNNIMIGGKSIIQYDTTLPTGSTVFYDFSNNNLTGSTNNLYDVLLQYTNLVGNNNTINTPVTYDESTNTGSYKALYTLIKSNLIGNNNSITNSDTTLRGTCNVGESSSIIGNSNTITINTDIPFTFGGYNENQLLLMTNINGNSNTLTNSFLTFSDLVGGNNVLSTIALKYSSIYGYANRIVGNGISGINYLSNLFMTGQNNTLTFNSATNVNTTGDINIVGNRNVITSTNNATRFNLFGYNNTLNSNVSDFSILGQYNTLTYTNGSSSAYLSILGGSNTFNADSGTSRVAISGESNNLIGYFTNSYFAGYGNNIRQTNVVGNPSTNLISNVVLLGNNLTLQGNSQQNLNINRAQFIGAANTYQQTNNVDYADYFTYIGSNNIFNGVANNVTLLGHGNTVSNLSYTNVIGISNTLSNTSNNLSTLCTNLFGYFNTINSNGSNYSESNTLLGNYISLKCAANSINACSHHTLLGDKAVIDYTTNTDAWQIKTAFGIYDLNGNGATLDYQGNLTVVGTVTSQGADFAEYWEWEDSNTYNEDRRGLFVTLSTNKPGYIKKATSTDKLLGIVSSNPTIAGGDDIFEWHSKYLKDVFGDYIYENVEEIDSVTGQTVIVKKRKLNPEYDPNQKYTSRRNRPEYACIAHIGKVVMIDDGNSNVGDYLTSNDNGIAVKSNSQTKFVCIKRIDATHIFVLIDNY
jgi:hypothetical protein